MNKTLSKEIMKRSHLRNKFLNTKRKAYNKQRNYIVILLRNEKKNFYSNLDTIDNRTFRRTVKPFLSEKVTKLKGSASILQASQFSICQVMDTNAHIHQNKILF